MKILYITTIGGTMVFFRDFIKKLLEAGNTVDIACNIRESHVPEYYREWGCGIWPLTYTRTPFDVGNIIAIEKIRKLVRQRKYDIVHCHTPIAAFCTRVACRGVRHQGTKVFYTAHGFHFYTGAPIKNWLIYYFAEWLCSWWTDVLITINREDYKRAGWHLHAKKTVYVPGVGIDTSRYVNEEVNQEYKMKVLGLPADSRMILSVGELNQNKNHESVIRAVSEIRDLKIHYLIAGDGELKKHLEEVAFKLKISDRVHLLGYRNDIMELYKCADLMIQPSFREGLSVAVMEAMAAGLPVICSDIRGNRDLIESEYLFSPSDIREMKKKIEKLLYGDKKNIDRSIFRNRKKIGMFDRIAVNLKMEKLYESTIEGVKNE